MGDAAALRKVDIELRGGHRFHLLLPKNSPTLSQLAKWQKGNSVTSWQPGWHHVNCQPSSYWIEKVETLGFHFHPELTGEARSRAGAGHFLHQGLVFKRA